MSTLIGNISVVIASVVALYGIRSWQVELRGRRRMELAEETLVLFYKVRDVFVAIRSPMGFADEGKTRVPDGVESKSQKRARDNAFVVYERYQAHREVFEQLISARYRFLAYFGADAAKPFDDVFDIKNKILLAARMLSDMWARPSDFYNENQQEAAQELISEKEKIIWWVDADSDELHGEVEAAVSQIEATCLAYLGKSSAPPANFWKSMLRGDWWR